jgi:histidinol dehydrogenase
VAVDLLAQAEHDPNARAYCLTDSIQQAQAIQQALEKVLTTLPLASFLKDSLAHSGIVVLETLEACAQAANSLAPEHLALMVENPDALTTYLTDYGALFMGYNTPVPVGDYVAGPNHTLPTSRAARLSGGLTPWTFLRPQTWMRTVDAKTLCGDAAAFAVVEGLEAHRASAVPGEGFTVHVGDGDDGVVGSGLNMSDATRDVLANFTLLRHANSCGSTDTQCVLPGEKALGTGH